MWLWWLMNSSDDESVLVSLVLFGIVAVAIVLLYIVGVIPVEAFMDATPTPAVCQ